jgi:hypothetical protein
MAIQLIRRLAAMEKQCAGYQTLHVVAMRSREQESDESRDDGGGRAPRALLHDRPIVIPLAPPPLVK